MKFKMVSIPTTSTKGGTTNLEQAFKITSIGEEISELAGEQDLGTFPQSTARVVTPGVVSQSGLTIAPPEPTARRGPSPRGVSGIRRGRSQLGHY
mmetsp:Transcript_5166/g.7955  ORF Transcript_5166/g.7955 Transcript_5166/m.7955 type:complete len:95 (+) Transcript_5166:1724-2008(+)